MFHRAALWSQTCRAFLENCHLKDYVTSAFLDSRQFKVTGQTNILFLNLSLKYAQGRQWEMTESERRRKKNKKGLRVTTVGARLSRFGINPLWLTSTLEIKAAICLKRLNNVRHSVKHTPAALYIMHQRPAEGLLRKDNMTYPWERRREEGRREGETGDRLAGTRREVRRLERDREGNERVSHEDLTRVYQLQYVAD